MSIISVNPDTVILPYGAGLVILVKLFIYISKPCVFDMQASLTNIINQTLEFIDRYDLNCKDNDILLK